MTFSYACYDACLHVPEMIDNVDSGILDPDYDFYGMGGGLDYYGNDRK
jgi:hypothetical protein